jgi:hypothetical protein
VLLLMVLLVLVLVLRLRLLRLVPAANVSAAAASSAPSPDPLRPHFPALGVRPEREAQLGAWGRRGRVGEGRDEV